ncbi:hypothetical protein [Rhizobium sp. RU36D]|uniref:hypothetical protein n=1 Tax=Rhizobium sp. RU36D TaxID=1907415 RepID=UPI0009D8250B|nr:hypothetical protein [Rhizobium sp. RU36D]SMC39473.1 hypothetical protein SAMN05880593_10124 [Rhizobium sp. RU36D]
MTKIAAPGTSTTGGSNGTTIDVGPKSGGLARKLGRGVLIAVQVIYAALLAMNVLIATSSATGIWEGFVALVLWLVCILLASSTLLILAAPHRIANLRIRRLVAGVSILYQTLLLFGVGSFLISLMLNWDAATQLYGEDVTTHALKGLVEVTIFAAPILMSLMLIVPVARSRAET